MSNDCDRRVTYRLFKEEPDSNAVAGVTLDARPVAATSDANQIALEVTLNPGETARVDVQPSEAPSQSFVPEGKVYAGKVLMRRALSEFRDEFLVKHPVMLASAKRVVRVLKASSDSLPRPGAERVTTR
jgi:hypothetical protein